MTADIRSYDVVARSTDVFGRVLCTARNQHFVVDGPVQNGCPGEAVTPAEIFLAGVATCGVELIQVLGRQAGVEVGAVSCEVSGFTDRSNPLHSEYTLFQAVSVRFFFAGLTHDQGDELVKSFKGR
jgi:uncharacterized OsmC-like protein